MNGWIMNKDEKVLRVENDAVVEVLNEAKAPLYFRTHNFIDEWLEDRCLDTTRINARLLKKALSLKPDLSEKDLSLEVQRC